MSKPGYTQQDFWIRLIFMLVYWVILNVSLSIFGFLVLVMTIIRFGSQHKPEGMIQFQFNLTEFITQILSFLIFKTDNKPFPFSPWPKVKDND
ncbi:DUF4389 domain-containing protein [Marinomonas sp. 15G1-11]|uniref:DUF4389 domain-containing protein n=1 Tax=Marinomonas phaeophyticola TaxID=3004091 RepID=A0ABT4JS62_9GAMM|nr:DUF4389 domain-containing protein [Marinomonas sp. 15G1-11]MCZ2720434.1 DUF4389 domain-containing protein [Marinomonas sp. 15G1-11]